MERDSRPTVVDGRSVHPPEDLLKTNREDRGCAVREIFECDA